MSDLPQPANPDDERRARLRASDADRELVHRLLAAAMANGNLSPTEYEERSSQAVVARTFGELDELTDDLPVTQLGVPLPDQVPAASGTRVVDTAALPPVTSSWAFMSGAEVGGPSVVADTLDAVAVMGGVEIDLREVTFTAPVLHLRCYAIMGGIDIQVPADVTLEINGMGIMGGFARKAAGPGAAHAPRISISGLALMGGVEVKRAEPRSVEG